MTNLDAMPNKGTKEGNERKMLKTTKTKMKLKKEKVKCNVRADEYLVLVEGIGDVVGHVAGWVGQNDDHMGAGGGRGSQPVGLGFDEGG